MKKYFLFVVIIFLLSGCAQKENNLEKNKTIKINDHEITVETADTPEEQYRGLSNQESLCENCGMLFIFNDKSERTFVMREMNFPLDIIFIDGDPLAGEAGKIVKIYKNLPPEGAEPKNVYKSGEPVDYVLEVNGGFSDKNGIGVGDVIEK